MLFLIFSLIVCTITPTDIVEYLTNSVFAPSNTPLRITRIHLNPQEEEISKEYVYKYGDKIRIDVDLGDSTITTFLYDGKTGFKKGKPLSTIGSLEMVLYGCTCGYLSAMEKSSVSLYEGREVLCTTGKQGNILYVDYRTNLPLRFEFHNNVVEFEEYKTIDGLGKIPFLIVKRRRHEVVEIIRITDVENQINIPVNFFSVPKLREGELLD